MVRSDVKSDIEFYFYLYCLELKNAGFIKEFYYESSTFALCEPYKRKYLVNGKKGVLEKEEHVLQKSSITADFTIFWEEKARNVFFLDQKTPIDGKVKDIPFRLAEEAPKSIPGSLIETKGMSESRTSSSISFPLKQKQLIKDQGFYIQKIKPYSPLRGKNCLFETTFTPIRVISLEVYKRDCKWGKRGSKKIKYPIRTLTEYLKLRGYE